MLDFQLSDISYVRHFGYWTSRCRAYLGIGSGYLIFCFYMGRQWLEERRRLDLFWNLINSRWRLSTKSEKAWKYSHGRIEQVWGQSLRRTRQDTFLALICAPKDAEMKPLCKGWSVKQCYIFDSSSMGCNQLERITNCTLLNSPILAITMRTILN